MKRDPGNGVQNMKNKTSIHDINWSALQGFPTLRKTASPQVKNYRNFSRVCTEADKGQSTIFLKSKKI